MSRYKNATVFENNLSLYKKAREKRDIPEAIVQFRMSKLPAPTVEQVMTIDTTPHIWTTGDRLYKLADEHYGDPTLWWVIAWYNGRPTEAHFKVGDVVRVPSPLERVLGILRL